MIKHVVIAFKGAKYALIQLNVINVRTLYYFYQLRKINVCPLVQNIIIKQIQYSIVYLAFKIAYLVQMLKVVLNVHQNFT